MPSGAIHCSPGASGSTLRAAHLGADLPHAPLVGLAQHEGHRQALVHALVGKTPVHREGHIDVVEDHERAPAVTQRVDALVLARRLRHALHRPGGERDVLSRLLVPADGGARLGDIDLKEHRNVVLGLGQLEDVEAGRARGREGQLLVGAYEVVGHDTGQPSARTES